MTPQPTPAALARIPERTVRSWPRTPVPRGAVPPGTDRSGRPRWHAAGCRTNGGALPPWRCPKCRSSISDDYEDLLRRLDRLSAGR